MKNIVSEIKTFSGVDDEDERRSGEEKHCEDVKAGRGQSETTSHLSSFVRNCRERNVEEKSPNISSFHAYVPFCK